jgi:hypothetical protein
MSLSFNYVPYFDGSNYGYWKSCLIFFLKSMDIWYIVEFGWTPPETAIAECTVLQKQTRVVNDRVMNALCLAISPA